MKLNAPTGNKPETPAAGVAHKKVLASLERHALKTRGGRFVSFPECRSVLSHLFHLKGDEAFHFLEEMEQQGLCRLIPYHGIILQ